MGSATASPLVGTAQTSSFIDPRTPLNVPVQLGSSLSSDNRPNPDKRFYGVRCEPFLYTQKCCRKGPASISLTSADNHKPRKSKSNKRTSTLSPNNDTSPDQDAPGLSIRDEDDEGNARMYTYSGRHLDHTKSVGGASYVLIYNPQTRRFTLEELSASYAFNLTCTPLEDDADELSRRYGTVDNDLPGSQVHPATNGTNGSTNNDEETDDLFGETQDGNLAPDSPPDKGNPFDFRHYIAGLPPPVKTSPGSLRRSPTPSQNASPLPTPKHFSPSFATSPRLTPRAAQTATPPKQKRKEPPVKPPPRPAKAAKRTPNSTAAKASVVAEGSASPIPSVQVQRPAAGAKSTTAPVAPTSTPRSSASHFSTKQKPQEERAEENEDEGEGEREDNSGLIIETAPDSTPSRNAAVSNARAGLGITTPGGGPISLRSVAASRSCSPATRPVTGEGREGGMKRSGLKEELVEVEVEDADVEEFMLGSPAVNRGDGGGVDASGGESGGIGDYDEEDAFARAMQEAVNESGLDAEDTMVEEEEEEEEEKEGGEEVQTMPHVPTTQQEESEEESEEE